MDSERLLQRFLRYVQIDTTANDATTEYPSSAGQWELGRVLVAELTAMGLTDVQQNRFGLVLATIPSNVPHAAPTIALNSHLDTSPETSGRNVRPQVIRDYAGGDIALPGHPERSIRFDDHPELAPMLGRTLITSDGTTLLGADDKAGLAIIMEVAERLQQDRSLPHGTVRILFTCDEEIGRGVDHVDLGELGAQVCYTLDGPAAGQIDVETFSADLATITFRGVNLHPALAKDRMINALRMAGSFLERLPRRELAPESTDQRQGFLHPYAMEGGVAEVTLRVLIRDFDTQQLVQHADRLRRCADEICQEYPGGQVQVAVTRQYRNLGDGLAREPRAVTLAEEAHRRLGLPCTRSIVRGGTDGSRLTELGLPTPNLSAGQHNLHSPLEWACLEEMQQAVAVVLKLLECWSQVQPE